MMGLKRWWILLMVVLSPLVTIAAAPQWASDAWEEFWDYPELQQNLKDLADERVQLNEASERIKNRIQIKEGILDEVEAGTLTFRAATDTFEQMDRDRVCCLYSAVRVGSSREMAAISVLRHLRTRLNVSHPNIGLIVARAIEEFEQDFGYHPPE